MGIVAREGVEGCGLREGLRKGVAMWREWGREKVRKGVVDEGEVREGVREDA